MTSDNSTILRVALPRPLESIATPKEPRVSQMTLPLVMLLGLRERITYLAASAEGRSRALDPRRSVDHPDSQGSSDVYKYIVWTMTAWGVSDCSFSSSVCYT